MSLYQEMTSEEKIMALEVFYETLDGYTDALTLLQVRKSYATTHTEISQLRIAIADVEADIALLKARIIAFKSNQYSMAPPSAELHSQVLVQVRELDAMIASAQTADTLVRAVSLLAQSYNQAAQGV
jgi:hypothetical protein